MLHAVLGNEESKSLVFFLGILPGEHTFDLVRLLELCVVNTKVCACIISYIRIYVKTI